MKIRNVKFLANANIKGNKKSNVIFALMILLVVSLTLISSYAVTITDGVNIFKDDTRAKMLEVVPWQGLLDNEVIKSIQQVDHVESVDVLQGMKEQVMDVLKFTNDNGEVDEKLQQQIDSNSSYVWAWSLIGDEKKDVIAGKSLDESPTLSCIIPSSFYPFEYEDTDENLEYIDGESLIGKTITVKAGENFEELYNYEGSGSEYGGNEWVCLPAIEYNLKIVGTYYVYPTSSSYYGEIYVSEETGKLIEQMAFEAGNIDLTDNRSLVAKWWNNPSLHNHYVTVDDYNNIGYVYNKLSELGIDCSNAPEFDLDESIFILANLFTIAGFVLVFATLLLCIINLIQSTTSSLQSRKGEIGLLKAIGYKNKQIFSCLYFEQLKLTVKGSIIGGVASAIVILIANFIFMHKSYGDRLYVVSWSYYFTFLAISVAVAVIVPLICQLLTLHKLNKIQPKDAMNDE